MRCPDGSRATSAWSIRIYCWDDYSLNSQGESQDEHVTESEAMLHARTRMLDHARMSNNEKNLERRKLGGHQVLYVSVSDCDINDCDLTTKNQRPAFSVEIFTTDQLSYDSEKKKKATNLATSCAE